jgi:hypothetical protein
MGGWRCTGEQGILGGEWGGRVDAYSMHSMRLGFNIPP